LYDKIIGLVTRMRDGNEVKRDVKELPLAVLISVKEVLPVHGRLMRVRAVGQRLTLQAQLV
jgi:hypothetical protein